MTHDASVSPASSGTGTRRARDRPRSLDRRRALAAASRRRATEIRLDERLLPPPRAHPFGTDDLGRDLFARVVAGDAALARDRADGRGRLPPPRASRSAARRAISAERTDLLLSRLIEVVLCFPVLFLLLALAAFLPPSPAAVILAIGLTTWPGDARYARAEILKARTSTTRAPRGRPAPRRPGSSCATCFPTRCRPCSSRRPSAWRGRSSRRRRSLSSASGCRPPRRRGAGSSRRRRPTSRRPGGWRSSRASRSS